MGFIFGWIGGAAGTAEPVLQRMAKRQGLAIADITPAVSQNSCLAVGGPAASLYSAPNGTQSAAVNGTLEWYDPDLAVIAEEYGPGPALIEAFGRYGRDAPQQIGGAAAYAILDHQSETLLVAIDRLAVTTLCLADIPQGGTVFGSTADLVSAHPDVPTVADYQAIYELLYFTRIPAPRTIYRDIRKLLPGQALWQDRQGRQVETYWKMAFSEDSAAGEAALGKELLETLEAAVQRAGVGCAPTKLGAYLSGGLDSSTVAGLLAKVAPTNGGAFSIGFDAEGFDEMVYARQAAKHFGIELHEHYVTPAEVEAFVPKMGTLYDEPFGNASAVPAYYCAKMAREAGVDCLLAGDGGDEIFAGNERYVKQFVFERYFKLPKPVREKFLEPVLRHLPGRDSFPLTRKAWSYVNRANIRLPQRMESYNFYNDIAVSDIFAPDLCTEIDPNGVNAVLEDHYWLAEPASTLNRMMYLDIRTTLSDDDLRKVVRTADLAGVGVRFPLLDQAVVDFAARVPSDLKIRHNTLRYFYRNSLQNFLPQSTLDKSKHGFGLPFGHWLKSDQNLAALTDDALASLRDRGIFQDSFLEGSRAQHRDGHASFYGEVVWVLVVLEMWLNNHPHLTLK
ncbi:MAG: asparagine synthetase B family protein [Magnetospiraceae bacterium]